MSNNPLSAGDKVAFGAVAAIALTVLIACIFLVVMGFIFSPVTNILLVLIIGTGTGCTLYATWRGSR